MRYSACRRCMNAPVATVRRRSVRGEDAMAETRRCTLCGQQAEAYEHAAYLAGEHPTERRYLGWLCWACARRHGSHAAFATALLAVAPRSGWSPTRGPHSRRAIGWAAPR